MTGRIDSSTVIAATAAFLAAEGRRPRVLVAGLAIDRPDRAPRTIAPVLAALGFDVDVGPAAASVDDLARQAVDNDVHAVVVPAPEPADRSGWQQWAAAVVAQGGTDIALVLDGPAATDGPAAADGQDGVFAVFTPGGEIQAALDLVAALSARSGHPTG